MRLWRGKESLDVLFGLEAGHLDVWAFTRNEHGVAVHGDQSYICMGGDALEGGLVREHLQRGGKWAKE